MVAVYQDSVGMDKEGMERYRGELAVVYRGKKKVGNRRRLQHKRGKIFREEWGMT